MEKKKKELISVIIPFYNQKEYFDECLNSALNQTYSNIEIIIINDGSSKFYEEKLLKIQSINSEKIKIFNQENKGVSEARNLGIRKSNGEYIAFLDSDDIWMPYKLEHQINLIKKYKLNFIHGSYLIVNEENRFIGKFLCKTVNYNQLVKSCDIGLSTVIVKSDLIKKHMFKEISTKEDFICWLGIVKEIHTLFGDSKNVMIYRDKKKSLSSNILQKFINAFKVYYKFEKKDFIKSIYYTLILSIYWVLKTYKIIYVNPDKVEFKYINNIQKIEFKNSFILSALNMASLSNINLFYLYNKKFIFWIDGYCAKFIVKIFNKIPGRTVIKDFKLSKDIKNVYLCGQESQPQIDYLKNKFNCKINFISVPFFHELDEIKKFKIDIDDNSCVILNIATPKQEILAINILNTNPNKRIFILCLGGGMSMVTGEEKIVPESMEQKNLEWLWRLRTNTWFRLKRLIITSIGFGYKMLINYFKKTNFINID